jgi:hypothetical protein
MSNKQQGEELESTTCVTLNGSRKILPTCHLEKSEGIDHCLYSACVIGGLTCAGSR